jgi:hypothetical protein
MHLGASRGGLLRNPQRSACAGQLNALERDTQDDDEQVSSAAKPPAQPAAPPPVVPAALNTLNIPINPASKVTQQELVRLSILAENQRSKLAERDGEASGGSDHGSRPGSGSVSSRRPSVHYTERIRRDSSSDQARACDRLGLTSS